MKKKDILSSPRLRELKKQRRKALTNKVMVFCIIGIVLLSGLTYFSRSSKFRIEDIQVTGNKIVESDAIKNIILNDLAGYYLWLFPKSNFLIYPQDKIAADLASNFKRLDDIKIDAKGSTKLEVSLNEREGKYLWCGEDISDKADDCYFMDQSGYLFDKAPFFSGNVYFKFFGNLDGQSENKTGEYFMPGNFGSILAFKSTLANIGVKPAALLTKPDGDMEFYLSSSLKAGPKIALRKDADLEKVSENLQAALDTEPLTTDFKKKFSNLEYIDLRFGNKVYYKFKSEPAHE
jgi:hypothetical protein